jgi:hypothetical protein
LLKRGNKNVDIKFSAHEPFWNNLHQVAQDQKIGKPNNSLGTDKPDVTPMRSDGQITADTKQKSNITNSVSPYSP